MNKGARTELNAIIQENFESIRALHLDDEVATKAIENTSKLAEMDRDETKLELERMKIENESRRIDLDEKRLRFEMQGKSILDKITQVANIVSPIVSGALYVGTFLIGLGFEKTGTIGSKYVNAASNKLLNFIPKVK